MNKKTSLFITLALSLIILCLIFTYFYSTTSNNSQSNTASLPKGQIHEVILNENGFSPQEITIKPGDLVKFTTTQNNPYWPASDLHPTHGIYPEFDPQEPVDPKTSWTFQFLNPGKWKYHDHLYPMYRGVVVVK